MCTLADYVMPCFMLIIGVAIPFSAAAAKARGVGFLGNSLRILRRTFVLLLLGWVLVYFRDQFAAQYYGTEPWSFKLGMDVLQLLALGYLIARFFYFLPPGGRALVAAGLLAWHWYLLRFWPQGPTVPAGTFTQAHEAIGDIYTNSAAWRHFTQWQWGDGKLVLDGKGLLSVAPAAAMMLIGTLMGDTLLGRQRGGTGQAIEPRFRAASLASWGLFLALAGFLSSFDIPWNKPRWSPSYIVYVSGVGALLLSILYAILDLHLVRAWAYAFAVFGANAIAVYFLSILTKILLLTTPRVTDDNYLAHAILKWGTFAMVVLTLGLVLLKFARYSAAQIGRSAYAILLLAAVPAWIMWDRFNLQTLEPTTNATTQPPIAIILTTLKVHLSPWVGEWLFTIMFVSFWWLVLDWMYRRRLFWRL
jgi:predicted acyltransferase